MSLKRCVQCHRAVRPYNTRKRDYPGTLYPGAKGMCNVCYHRTLPPKPKKLVTPKLRKLDAQAQAAKKLTPAELQETIPVRVNISLATYRVLTQATKGNIGLLLSKVADQIAIKVG